MTEVTPPDCAYNKFALKGFSHSSGLLIRSTPRQCLTIEGYSRAKARGLFWYHPLVYPTNSVGQFSIQRGTFNATESNHHYPIYNAGAA